MFTRKNRKNSIPEHGANKSIVSSLKIPLSPEKQEFNNACKQELNKIIDDINKTTKLIILDWKTVNYLDNKTKILNHLNSLNNKKDNLLSQMISPINNKSLIMEMAKKISDDINDIRSYLNEPDHKASHSWYLQKYKEHKILPNK